MEERVSIDLAADPVSVFGLVADFGRLQEWDPNVTSSRWRADSGPLVGEHVDVVARFLGMQAPIAYELVAWEPPHTARYVGRARRLVSHDTVRVESRGDGCRVEFSADVTLRGVMRLLRPILPLVFAAGARRAMGALRKHVA